MELFVSLTGLSSDTLYDEKILIHLPRSNDFTLSWMNLLKIPHHRLIFDPIIKAKVLYAPEPARCGEIYATQLEWINRFNPLPKEEQELTRHREILHIIPSESRPTHNQQEINNRVKEFATKHGYTYISHSEDHLPSLSDQILRFAKVPIVIAPHDAGLLFTAFSPHNACIREFMPPRNSECYARIGFMKRLNYRMYMENDNQFNMKDLEESLMDCHQHFETSLSGTSDSQTLEPPPFINTF